MRIGLNIRYLQNALSGIETYVYNLITHLEKIDTNDEYYLYCGHRNLLENHELQRMHRHVSRFPTKTQIQKLLWTHWRLPREMKKDRLDLFHEPSFIVPLMSRIPTVVTVYDLAFKYVPHGFTKRNRMYLDSLLRMSIARARGVIAISECTRDDILNSYPVFPDKVHVIPLAASDVFRKLSDTEKSKEILRKYGIIKQYILTVSKLSPRKNVVRLLKAFKVLKEKHDMDYQLVIVGSNGWLYEDVYKAVQDLGLVNDVIFCGYIEYSNIEDMVLLYNQARVFVFPSLYEGFGIPILEAMKCDCPVVTSNVSSMPEVGGNAAVYVDPYSVEDIVEGILKITDNDQYRAEMIEKGKTRAQGFSWDRVARETYALYKTI